jgi:hypothetical protein
MYMAPLIFCLTILLPMLEDKEVILCVKQSYGLIKLSQPRGKQ